MAWITTLAGVRALSSHVLQIIEALNGTAGSGQAIKMTQLTDNAEPALDVRNLGTGGALRVRDVAGTTILQANEDGVTVGDTLIHTVAATKVIPGATSWTLRNNADSASSISVTDAGEVTKPRQPAFLAYNSVTDANQTGAGTTVSVTFDTEVFDQGADFAANVFTAPVTGKYRLTARVLAQDLTAAMTAYTMNIVTSNRTYQSADIFVPPASGSRAIELNVLADMDAADTAIVQLNIANGAGDTADIYGGTPMNTYFCGYLVA